jgi:hypothetical protein
MNDKTKNNSKTNNSNFDSYFENLDVFEKQETGYPSVEMVVDGKLQRPENVESIDNSMH